MTQDFEYISYKEADRIAMLEDRAAELERRLLEVTPPGGLPAWAGNAAEEGGHDRFRPGVGATGARTRPRGSDGRTEALTSRGRPRARSARARWLRAHWQGAGLAAAVALVGVLILVLVAPGRGASWPASVTRVQTQITTACLNANVAAEPSQVNFACARATQSVLWVFSLLTSGDSPSYADARTGRRGLEPITPAQGGDIAWSLNLHHPYDPASPVDSLQVAARAINNIIGGATLTSASGKPVIQPGLESKAANCARYTGSARLVSRAGFPARCARPVTSAAGQAALVGDVFAQWMGSTATPRLANEAQILFENASNPGNLRVQGILATLPQ